MFKSHYNHALGKMIHTRSDYLKEMKRQGCEPFDPSKVKKREQKKYEPSKWGREIAKAGADQMREHGRVSGVVMKELIEKSNLKATPQEIKNKLTGGMYSS